MAFGNIGFDHPGHYGLDFDDFLFLIAIQVGLTALSIGLIIWRRRWAMLPIPLLVAILTVISVIYGD